MDIGGEVVRLMTVLVGIGTCRDGQLVGLEVRFQVAAWFRIRWRAAMWYPHFRHPAVVHYSQGAFVGHYVHGSLCWRTTALLGRARGQP